MKGAIQKLEKHYKSHLIFARNDHPTQCALDSIISLFNGFNCNCTGACFTATFLKTAETSRNVRADKSTALKKRKGSAT